VDWWFGNLGSLTDSRLKKGLAVLSKFRSIRALLAFVTLSATALLAGCGGGGAKDPFDTGPAAPPLVVNPTAVTVYSNIPTVITVSSGTAPFQAFTSDSVVLPVVSAFSGTLLTLTPSNVVSDTAVTITIQDATGQRVAVGANVKPATLVGSTEIVPLSNSTCGGGSSGGGTPGTPASGASSGPVGVCSGETATVNVVVRNANTAPIPNRQVRFDAIFGAFKFVTDANGTNPSTTVTAVTDQNGRATTLIKLDDGVTSQAAVIRTTDLVTGNRVDTAFTIVQKTAGAGVLSVVPGGYTGKAFFKGTCGGTSGDFLVYGGRPPYTARSSLPNAVRLSIDGVIGDPVTVLNTGGSFRATTQAAACVGYEAAIVVTDATGRSVTVTYKEEEGENDVPTPPAPTTLVISPPGAQINCANGRTISFTIAGGTGPYTITTDRPDVTSVTGTILTITGVGGITGQVIFQVTDARSNRAAATVTCI
jgi:hypothetical protein